MVASERALPIVLAPGLDDMCDHIRSGDVVVLFHVPRHIAVELEIRGEDGEVML
jgi:hypothetical protein